MKKNNSKATVEVKATVENTATEQKTTNGTIATISAFESRMGREMQAKAEKAKAEKRNMLIELTTAASVEEKPATVEENTATEENTAAIVEEMTATAIAAGIKVDWTFDQMERWLKGAARDNNGKYTFVEDAQYKNIEKNPGWRPTLQIITENGKLRRAGKNFGEVLILQGKATKRVINDYREEKTAEKEKAKAEKAAARQAKKAAKLAAAQK